MIALVSVWLMTMAVNAAEPSTPPRAAALVGKSSALNGPNCWNSALYGAGLVSGIRHVDYDEFTAWLESPLCREVKESEAAAGDIVALRRVSKGGKLVRYPYSPEIHGYLLLAPGIAFTKNGTAKGESYRIQDVSVLHLQYERTNRTECRMFDIPKEFCVMRPQYFRCAPDKSEVLSVEQKILELENRLHRLYTGEYFPNSLELEKEAITEQLKLLQPELDALATEAPAWKIELLKLRLFSARIFQF